MENKKELSKEELDCLFFRCYLLFIVIVSIGLLPTNHRVVRFVSNIYDYFILKISFINISFI